MKPGFLTALASAARTVETSSDPIVLPFPYAGLAYLWDITAGSGFDLDIHLEYYDPISDEWHTWEHTDTITTQGRRLTLIYPALINVTGSGADIVASRAFPPPTVFRFTVKVADANSATYSIQWMGVR